MLYLLKIIFDIYMKYILYIALFFLILLLTISIISLVYGMTIDFLFLIIRIHCFKINNRSNQLKNLEDFDRIMKKYKIFYWLGEGTALGAIREKNIIKNDSDVDVGIYIKDYNKFVKIVVPKLLENGFKIGRKKPFSISKNGEYIDVDITGYNLPCMAFNYPKSCNYHIDSLKPFRYGYINNKKYVVPSEKYIKKLYGEKWYIPINKKPKNIIKL